MSPSLWTILAFVAGALPFSVWAGRLVLNQDIREFGDHNPGAANAYRAGGLPLGATAVLLDFLKGALPVGLATHVTGIEDWALVPIALAPVLGHAFSPFLRFRGGKALAVTFGIWTGLTLWLAPTALGIFMAIWLVLVSREGWAVLLAMSSLLAVLLLTGSGAFLLAVWLGNLVVLAWTHRQDLAHRPRLRSGAAR
jgi:acyl phosphate:glycerol-3-phosphate acyltransferase